MANHFDVEWLLFMLLNVFVIRCSRLTNHHLKIFFCGIRKALIEFSEFTSHFFFL